MSDLKISGDLKKVWVVIVRYANTGESVPVGAFKSLSAAQAHVRRISLGPDDHAMGPIEIVGGAGSTAHAVEIAFDPYEP